jgi:Zn finger protein HypA/HybF involved in hydrogenase expression
MIASISFTCPQCNKKFEFDVLGENEFVPCPICGTNFFIAKKGNKLILESFERTLSEELSIMV